VITVVISLIESSNCQRSLEIVVLSLLETSAHGKKFDNAVLHKESYLYKKSNSAETRWHAVDWVTTREFNVLATDSSQNDMFSGCTVYQSPAHHLVSAEFNVLATDCG
jgi:hypothetical protein